MYLLKKFIKNILPYFILKYYWKKKKITYKDGLIHYNSFQNMSIAIRKSIQKLPPNIDLIVGIPRSGMIPAYMIALFLNKPCCSLTEFKNNISPENGQRKITQVNKKEKVILIVDDSVGSGRAIQKAKNDINNITLDGCYRFLYYAVFATSISKNYVDFYATVTKAPRIFQWNYMYHSILNTSCVDFDGVLCRDPTTEENDDGKNYRNFLLTAQPLYIPNTKIYAIVTARLEKYRFETETWLKNNNIKYEKLIMLNLASAQERNEKNCHAAFKAAIYKQEKKATLFIESNNQQAYDIARISKKPCLCIETDIMYE